MLSVTQIFFILCYICVLISLAIDMIFFLCFRPEGGRFILISLVINGILMAVGVTGGTAIIVYAVPEDKFQWVPCRENRVFHWAIVIGVVGAVVALLFGIVLFLEGKKSTEEEETP